MQKEAPNLKDCIHVPVLNTGCHFFQPQMLSPTGIISLPGKYSINTESRLEKMKPPRKGSLSDSRAESHTAY